MTAIHELTELLFRFPGTIPNNFSGCVTIKVFTNRNEDYAISVSVGILVFKWRTWVDRNLLFGFFLDRWLWRRSHNRKVNRVVRLNDVDWRGDIILCDVVFEVIKSLNKSKSTAFLKDFRNATDAIA